MTKLLFSVMTLMTLSFHVSALSKKVKGLSKSEKSQLKNVTVHGALIMQQHFKKTKVYDHEKPFILTFFCKSKGISKVAHCSLNDYKAVKLKKK